MVFYPFFFDFTAGFSFFFCPNKRKTKQKENSPSAFFCLLQCFFPLKKKNSLTLKQLFLFNAPKSTSASRQKKEAGPGGFLGGGDNIASLVGVGVFASLVRVDVFVYVIRIFRTASSTARLPLFGRLNEITDKKRKTRFK